MFSRFTPLIGLRGSQGRRAVSEGRSLRRCSRPHRNRAWFQLEGLEERFLLSITEFSLQPFANERPYLIAAGPDGNLWFTDSGASKIGMINPTTGAITDYPLPSAPNQSEGIAVGSDGNLWFTEYGYTDVHDNQIGVINPSTHAITEFDQGPAITDLWGLTAGPDGNLWFTEDRTDKIGMINPATHAITEFAVPTAGSTPFGITAGPDGNLWFTESNSSVHQIGRINPVTGAITEFLAPYTNSQPTGIKAGPDGNLWFTDSGGVSGVPAIGVITPAPDSSHLVVTQQPQASVTAGTGFGLMVQAQDGSGNAVTSFNGVVTVSLASNPGGAALGGTMTVTASSGVATFPGLTLDKAASGYTLIVSGIGVTYTTSNTVTVTPAAATKLVITQQPPATVQVNKTFALKASIEDQYGNLVTTASGTVTVAFANNPMGATLGGTASVTASQGVASFTNLTINKIGTGYTLRVASSGLTSAITNPINVTKNGRDPSTLLATAGNSATELSLAPLVLDSPDLWDGLRSHRVYKFGAPREPVARHRPRLSHDYPRWYPV
jgi:streptogramin lyase